MTTPMTPNELLVMLQEHLDFCGSTYTILSVQPMKQGKYSCGLCRFVPNSNGWWYDLRAKSKHSTYTRDLFICHDLETCKFRMSVKTED